MKLLYRKKKHEKKELSKLMKTLSKKSVSDVKFNWHTISLKYDNKRLKAKVVMRKHLRWVGEWSYRKNTVHFDDDLLAKDVVPVLVHELVEMYVAKTYNLDEDKEAHPIAQIIERRFFREHNKLGLAWPRHEKRVTRVWRKERKWHNERVKK